MNGAAPFLVKKVAFKCCAAPSRGQKMYGRISNADGSVYDNSYIGNTIAWQKAAATTYEFQAISMHFADDGGGKLRAWLVSGGPFLFARNTGSGTTQTAGGKNLAGTPVGYIQYAEVALAPSGLKVARDSSDANKATFSWSAWDPKADFDAVGGTYAVSGYVVQVAKDSAFTDSVRLLYVSKGYGEAYGLFSGYDWYFRICTRNEVSEHYSLPGGQWSDAVKLAASTSAIATPSSSAGTSTGSSDNGANTDVDDSSSLSDNNPNSSSNSAGSSDTTSEPTTIETTEDRVHGDVRSAKAQMSDLLPQLTDAANQAHGAPTQMAWNTVASRMSTAYSLAGTLATVAFDETKAQWASEQTAIDAARTAATQAGATAAATQTAQNAFDAAKSAAMASRNAVYDAVAAAKKKATASTWTAVGNRLQDLQKAATNAAAATSDSSVKGGWTTTANAAKTAITAARTAATKLTSALEAKARTAALAAVSDADSAKDASPDFTTDYSAAEDAISDVVSDLGSLLDETDDTETVTVTTVIPAATTVPSTVGTGDVGAATATTTSTTDTSTNTTTSTVVYTPIPDTSADRTQFGGLLQSKGGGTRSPGHVAYLMDRGGRQRIRQFVRPTQLSYNRIRDDISEALLTFSGDALTRNRTALQQMAVGRHELMIFRGTERVWEGPITLASFAGGEVQVHAKDICHYLNRTVLKNNYSNAYPNLDYVVNRIAGIIANELAVKESLDPPVNVLPFMRTYIEQGDARTTRVSLAAESTVWGHLDDLAAKAGIDYTVIGRALHIWDTSRAALGRIRALTEDDFIGDSYIAEYGMETATQTFVTDGQGNFGRAGGVDDFYGEIDLLATAYDENGNSVNSDDADTTNDTVPIEEMTEQAERNLKGRNPTPTALKISDDSSFRLDRGIGMDVLLPGVYVPISATFSGRQVVTTMKLKELKVSEDSSGETVQLSLTPASASDLTAALEEDS